MFIVFQKQCNRCGKIFNSTKSSYHYLCKTCNNLRLHPPSTSTSKIQALFQRTTKTLDQIQRSSIITLHKLGYNAKRISTTIPCNIHTVYLWLYRYKRYNNITNAPKSGRKRKILRDITNKIVNEAKETIHTTPKQIRHKLQLNYVSARSIRRTLDKHKIHGRVAKKQYPFTNAHVKKRLSFGNGYLLRTNWNDVLFSDEKTFTLMSNTSRQWVQIPENTNPFNPKYTVNKQAHSEKVQAFAVFSSAGVGDIVLFDEYLDERRLKNILSNHLIPSAKRLFGNGHFWLLHDNDPKFKKSKLVQKWLHNNGIQVIDFPPYSGDANPMENLWSDLNRRVENRFATTIDELKQYIVEEWNQTSLLMLSKLVHSMTKRLQSIVNNKGNKTKY